MKTKKESNKKTEDQLFLAFRQIRTICEDPGNNQQKLDEIHKIADAMVYYFNSLK